MGQEEVNRTDTICAIATATGGALGIIRVSGPAALTAVSAISTVRCDSVAANTIHYGTILSGPVRCDSVAANTAPSDPVRCDSVAANTAPNGTIEAPSGAVGGGTIIDECMVSVFRAPHSYTGEDSVELSCHGSTYILNKVLELLVQHGCRMARPGEYTQRAYLNGKLDLSQAEAVADLIASSNRTTHQMAMSQLRGHFSSELARLREQLLHLTSLLELELDFSDHEDLEFANRSDLLQLTRLIGNHIRHLADSFQNGNALKNGIPVAIIGAPNVGKSTLLNALLGEERAIVSDIQGTTRDAIEDTINLAGITFRFIDTAGIRHTSDTIEQIGIERSIAAAERARIILMMTEPGIPYPDIPVSDDQIVLHVINKVDLQDGAAAPLPSRGKATVRQSSIGNGIRGEFCISAKHGIGLDTLKQQLIAAAPTFSETDVIVTNARHYEALTRANSIILQIIDGIEGGLSGDLLAEDLRQALEILGEITGGQILPQETLNTIFSHFCVGK